jgi:hypothetical protein
MIMGIGQAIRAETAPVRGYAHQVSCGAYSTSESQLLPAIVVDRPQRESGPALPLEMLRISARFGMPRMPGGFPVIAPGHYRQIAVMMLVKAEAHEKSRCFRRSKRAMVDETC